jgi:hypothetical protein
MGTQRSKADLDALFQDNSSGLITPLRLRDLVETLACTSGSLYITAPAATPISVPGTFTKASGGTTQVDDHRVEMPGDNRLTYMGDATVHIHLVVNLSAQCASNNQVLGFAVAKNGAVVEHSVMEHFIGNATDVKVMAIHADMDMEPNDYVELWVTNYTSTGAVTVKRGYMYFMGIMCD